MVIFPSHAKGVCTSVRMSCQFLPNPSPSSIRGDATLYEKHGNYFRDVFAWCEVGILSREILFFNGCSLPHHFGSFFIWITTRREPKKATAIQINRGVLEQKRMAGEVITVVTM
jgi:hypothetical protein